MLFTSPEFPRPDPCTVCAAHTGFLYTEPTVGTSSSAVGFRCSLFSLKLRYNLKFMELKYVVNIIQPL